MAPGQLNDADIGTQELTSTLETLQIRERSRRKQSSFEEVAKLDKRNEMIRILPLCIQDLSTMLERELQCFKSEPTDVEGRNGFSDQESIFIHYLVTIRELQSEMKSMPAPISSWAFGLALAEKRQACHIKFHDMHAEIMREVNLGKQKGWEALSNMEWIETFDDDKSDL